MKASVWSAIAAWVTVLIYAALLVYAVKQVGEAKRFRKAQVRPFVVVDVAPGFVLYITVENIGNTLARNVSFEFPVPLESSLARPWEVEESPLLRDGVKVLPPRKRYRIFFDSFPARTAAGSTLPMSYDVIVKYEDDEHTPYKDSYVLDLNSFMHASPDEKGLPDVVEALEKVGAELAKWTDGTGALLVHGRDKDRYDEELRDRAERWREQFRAKSDDENAVNTETEAGPEDSASSEDPPD